MRRLEDRWEELGVTDSAGRLSVPDAPLDGSWHVGAWAQTYTIQEPHYAPRARAPLTRETVLRLRCGAQVTARVVDAETGEPIPGASWGLRETSDDLVWSESDATQHALVGPDGRTLSFVVRVPEPLASRYVVGVREWDGFYELAGCTSPEQRAVLPLRRSVTVKVRGVDADGRALPTTGVDWKPDGPGPAFIPWRAGRGEQGLLEHLLRIPFFRGARVRVVLRGGDLFGGELVSFGKSPPPAPLGVVVRVTETEPPFERGDGRLTGRGGGGGSWGPRDEQGARLHVRVIAADGTTPEGAWVRIRSKAPAPGEDPALDLRETERDERTGPDGTTAFKDLPPGEYSLQLDDDRYVRASRTLVLARGATPQSAELREPRGVELAVTAIDEAGAGLPFALLWARDRKEGLAEAGLSPRQLDPFTDAAGKRTFRRLPPGAIRVQGVYGGRKGEATIQVEDGGRAEMRLVLAPSAGPPGK
jgi:hypothetical protein